MSETKPRVGTLTHRVVLELIKGKLPDGARYAHFYFSGSGDSGDLQDYKLSEHDGYDHFSMDGENNPFWDTVLDLPDDAEHRGKTVLEILTSWAWDAIEKVDVDWVNNDGGDVTCTFDFTSMKTFVSCNQNIVSQEAGTSYALDIATFEHADWPSDEAE